MRSTSTLVPLLASLTLTACGVQEYQLFSEDKQKINPALLEYVHEFERDFGQGISSSVLIGEPASQDTDLLAECQIWKGTRNKIIFNARVFNQLSPIILKAVFYHEAGHCELGLDHSAAGDRTLTDPYTYTGESKYYETNWSALVADLKSKAGRN